ncbi:MAG: hypothetical protein HFJ41_06270 [Clostridia bacterium]|nr:hypothetical protein [Clostridia bacterium]
MQNNILDIPQESTLDTKFEVKIDNNNSCSYIDTLDGVSNNDINLNNNIDTKTDCLALTVRDNYHIVVVKNLFKKGFRVSWKVALSIFTINFLNMFL